MEAQNALPFLAVSEVQQKLQEDPPMSLACSVLLPRSSSSNSWQAVLLMFSSLTTFVKYFKTDHIMNHLIV
jgi:hypothetical protein